MSFPETLTFNNLGDPFRVQYLKQTTPLSMVKNHIHNYYEVYVLLSGERVYFIEGHFYSIRKGDLVFIGKNELHKTVQAGTPSHERLLIYFDDRLLQSAYQEHANLLLTPFHQESHVLRFPKQELAAIDLLISRIMTELKRTPVGCEIVLTHSIIELLLSAARFLNQHTSLSLEDTSPIHKKMSTIVRYINDHYAEPMPLNELAERFYISTYYLSRKFKVTTGFTLSDYLNRTRVKEAQRLLRESDIKIIDVAAQVGFDNFSHFGKTFKKIALLSPRAYRKQLTGSL